MEPEARSSRKIALEKIKGVSNARFDYLKRLHDRQPLCQLYAEGKVELHIHYSMNGMFCATYRAADGTKAGMATKEPRASKFSCYAGEIPVFVPVGGVSKDFRPLASSVGLKFCQFCNMRGVDTLEPTILPSRETLFRAFHGELSLISGPPAIEPRKVIDKKIHSASEVIANLSDQDADKEIGPREIVWRAHLEFMRRIRIELTNHSLLLLPLEGFDLHAEVTKVFLCPSNPRK